MPYWENILYVLYKRLYQLEWPTIIKIVPINKKFQTTNNCLKHNMFHRMQLRTNINKETWSLNVEDTQEKPWNNIKVRRQEKSERGV